MTEVDEKYIKDFETKPKMPPMSQILTILQEELSDSENSGQTYPTSTNQQSNNKITSQKKEYQENIGELGGLLVALFAKAEQVRFDESNASFYLHEVDLIHFREISQRAATNLSMLKKQAEAYELKLSHYIDNRLYENDWVNYDSFLQDTTSVRKESISSIRVLIRDLSFTKNKNDYIQYRESYKNLIRLTNKYISAVNLVVQNNKTLLEVFERLGINLQQKYQLELLTKQDIYPSGKYAQNVIIDGNIDNLLDFLLNSD